MDNIQKENEVKKEMYRHNSTNDKNFERDFEAFNKTKLANLR